MKVIDKSKFHNAKNASFSRECERCGITFNFNGDDIIHKKFLIKKSPFYKKNYVTCPYCHKKLNVYGYKFAVNNNDCIEE